MKLLAAIAFYMLLPVTLAAKPQYLTTQEYQQAKKDYQLRGAFPELIVFNAEQKIILHCDAKQHEVDACFDKALDLAQQSEQVISLFTLDAPFCPVCLNWNTQLQQLSDQSRAAVSIYYVGN